MRPLGFKQMLNLDGVKTVDIKAGGTVCPFSSLGTTLIVSLLLAVVQIIFPFYCAGAIVC